MALGVQALVVERGSAWWRVGQHMAVHTKVQAYRRDSEHASILLNTPRGKPAAVNTIRQASCCKDRTSVLFSIGDAVCCCVLLCTAVLLLLLQLDYFSSSSSSALRAVFSSWSLDECHDWLDRQVGLRMVLEEETRKWFPASNSGREVSVECMRIALAHVCQAAV